ncbi:hypothetical protein CYMTET_10613 [Cymbomonas tetramitiformis]|uniref:Uncharacterized protein n=1 Tax=Cymbomonas tetramitiformis TaxID=36881 RepID=A0AAE0GQD0_9CHLO|nr:hypothetical protein CYMTET_10613 [Cymbomonas tetramitiformis]
MLSGKPADNLELVPVNKPPPPYQNQYTHNAVYDQYESYVPAISRHSGLDKRRPRRAPEKEQVLRNSSRVTLFPNGCVAAGGYHTAVVDEEGCLYTWGCGTHGQLGMGFPEVKAVGMKREFDAVEPKHVKMFSAHYRAVQVSAGRDCFSLLLPLMREPSPGGQEVPVTWQVSAGGCFLLLAALMRELSSRENSACNTGSSYKMLSTYSSTMWSNAGSLADKRENSCLRPLYVRR